MSISSIRSVLYKTGRILGDINAVKRGKILQRVGRRVIGKGVGRVISRIKILR